MMKRFATWMLAHQKIFYIVIAAILLSIIGLPLVSDMFNRRQKYKWIEFHDWGRVENNQPFGAKYLDEHLRSYWQKGVIVDTVFSDVLSKHVSKPCNILMLSDNDDYFYDKDRENLVKAVQAGSRIIAVTDDVKYTYPFYVDGEQVHYFNIEDYTVKKVKRDTIRFEVPNQPNKFMECTIWDNMRYAEFTVSYGIDPNYSDDYLAPDTLEYVDDETDAGGQSEDIMDVDTVTYDDASSVDGNYDSASIKPSVKFDDNGSLDLVKDLNGRTFVLQRLIGKGKITYVGIDVLYANYGMSVPELQKMSDRIMDETFDRNLPLIVLYKVDDDASSNYDEMGEDYMFYVLLEHKETALALTFLLIMLLFWLAFNSRRRRNAVQQIPLEKNTNMEYIKHIATLYTHNSDYKDLLKIEQRKLLYRLRKEYQFDIATRSFTTPSDFSALIARSKGLNETEVREALLALEDMTTYPADISRTDYLKALKMLSILNKK